MLSPEEAHSLMLRDRFLLGLFAAGLLLFLIRRPQVLHTWISKLSPAVLFAGIAGFFASALWVFLAYQLGHLAHYEGFSLRLTGSQLTAAPLAARYYPVSSKVPVNKFYVLSDSVISPGRLRTFALRYLGAKGTGDELGVRSIEVDGDPKSYELLLRHNPALIGRDRIVLRSSEALTVSGISRQARVSLAPPHFGGELELLVDSVVVGRMQLTQDRVAGRFISFDLELDSIQWMRGEGSDSRLDQKLELRFPATGLRINRVEVQPLAPGSLGAVEKAEFVSNNTSLAKTSFSPQASSFWPSDPDFNARHSNFLYLCMFLAPVFFGLIALTFTAGLRYLLLKRKVTSVQLASFFISLLFIQFLVLIDVWPGSYTADSFIFPGIEGGLISNYKPIIYTVYLGILRCISSSPASPLVFQILIAAAVFSALAAECFNRGKIGWLGLLAGGAILLISPVFPLYLVTLWKDIPYGVGVASVFLAIFYLQRAQIKLSNHLLVWLFVPFVVFVTGFRHTGALGALVVFAALYAARSVTRVQVVIAVCAFLGLSAIFASFVNVFTDSKARTEYDRLQLFPYIIYASYLPLREHLDSLSPRDATSSRAALEKVASVDDFNGIDLMFTPEKVRFNLNDTELRSFSQAVLRGIISNPVYFSRCLLSANWKLLTGAGYIWDRGFLPLPRRLAFDGRFYFPDDYVVTPSVLTHAASLGVARLFEDLLLARGSSKLLYYLFSYLPHLLVLVVTVFLHRRAPAAAIFAAGTLTAHAGVFLMPASMEFRYGFSLMVSGILCPLLVAIDWRTTKLGERNCSLRV